MGFLLPHGQVDPGAQDPSLPQPAMVNPGILNQAAPQTHPLNVVGQLISDHTNLLRQRLFAAHANGGLAPVDATPRTPVNIMALMGALPAATASNGYSHLQALNERYAQNQGM